MQISSKERYKQVPPADITENNPAYFQSRARPGKPHQKTFRPFVFSLAPGSSRWTIGTVTGRSCRSLHYRSLLSMWMGPKRNGLVRFTMVGDFKGSKPGRLWRWYLRLFRWTCKPASRDGHVVMVSGLIWKQNWRPAKLVLRLKTCSRSHAHKHGIIV